MTPVFLKNDFGQFRMLYYAFMAWGSACLPWKMKFNQSKSSKKIIDEQMRGIKVADVTAQLHKDNIQYYN